MNRLYMKKLTICLLAFTLFAGALHTSCVSIAEKKRESLKSLGIKKTWSGKEPPNKVRPVLCRPLYWNDYSEKYIVDYSVLRPMEEKNTDLLFKAIEKGSLSQAKKAILNCANVNAEREIACKKDSEEEESSCGKERPLDIAVKKGYVKIARLLVAKNADFDCEKYKSEPPKKPERPNCSYNGIKKELSNSYHLGLGCALFTSELVSHSTNVCAIKARRFCSKLEVGLLDDPIRAYMPICRCFSRQDRGEYRKKMGKYRKDMSSYRKRKRVFREICKDEE